MNLTPVNTKICASCSKAFGCTGEEDCWCENARINKKEFLIVMNTYQDCICPDCLEQYSETATEALKRPSHP